MAAATTKQQQQQQHKANARRVAAQVSAECKECSLERAIVEWPKTTVLARAADVLHSLERTYLCAHKRTREKRERERASCGRAKLRAADTCVAFECWQTQLPSHRRAWHSAPLRRPVETSIVHTNWPTWPRVCVSSVDSCAIVVVVVRDGLSDVLQQGSCHL